MSDNVISASNVLPPPDVRSVVPEELIAMNGGAGVPPATPYQVKLQLNEALRSWTKGKITDIDQMPDYVNLERGSRYQQLDELLSKEAASASSGRITDWKYLLPPPRAELLNRRLVQWQAELNYRTLITDARADVRANLGVALSQLSGGKITSLAQLEGLKNVKERESLTTRLNTEVQKASGGDLKSYQELLAKADASHAVAKPGYDPGASLIYSVTGSVVAYNLLRSAGLTSQEALMKIPGSAARSFITASIAQLPTGIKDPYLQVLYKGGVGAVLTAGIDLIAGKVHADAALPPVLNKGMIAAAFTTAGAVVGLNELQKNGYLGGLPPSNPKNWEEWFKKYIPQSAAISVGLTPPVVIASILNQARSGVPLTPGGIAKNIAITAGLPLLQNLLANAIVNPPGGGKPPPWFDFMFNAASGAGFDQVTNAFRSPGAPPTSPGNSIGKGLGYALLVEYLKVGGTIGSLALKDIKDINTARQALTEIEELLKHTFVHAVPSDLPLAPTLPFGGHSVPPHVTALKQAREDIYKKFPELRPAAR